MNDFFLAYVEVALWSSNDESTPEGGEPLDRNYGIDDIHPKTLERMMRDCNQFQSFNANDLTLYDHPQYNADELGGHDFWLTRNGHDAGFWDRYDCLPEVARVRLTAASKKFGEFNLYVGDDGKIHGDQI